jgi:hypothetical protein
MAHPSVWIGVAGVLAFTLVPYLAVLGASGRIKRQLAAGSRISAALVFVVVLCLAYRSWLWSLVPADEKTLSYWNWPILGGLMLILTAAELKMAGITDTWKRARGLY